MGDPVQRLRQVPLFDGMSDEDLQRICREVEEVHLDPGDMLFSEGDMGDCAYFITDGDVEILKATARRDTLLAVRHAGDVIGEMALLQEEPRNATARARTAVDVLSIPKAALDEVLDTSPVASRALFGTFLARLRATHDQLRQGERMTQLGTLTAGVAHELNNPAAAVGRAADRLGRELGDLVDLARIGTTPARAAALELVDPRRQAPTNALARSDAEDAIEAWLDEHAVPEPWTLAAGLVDAGLEPADLDGLEAAATGEVLADALRVLTALTSLQHLAGEIGAGASRISSIVRALKSYSYLDQSPVQDVDVHRGLEDTLMLLANRTRDVTVVREFADDLPTITALGTELNQVWTNLVDNALDALEGVEDPTLTLRTRRDGDSVVVEVEDNGSGIAEQIQDRIFDAFFTTKPPGHGTGLGLQISYRIVVLEHRGDLVVESRPGRTVFRAVLPVRQPTDRNPSEGSPA